jgi:hypothetical protein
MFGTISQASHLRVAIVAADDEERLDDHRQRQYIDQKELKGCRVKAIAAEEAHRTVNQDPARHIKQKEERRRSPLMTENAPRSRFSGSRSRPSRRLQFPVAGITARPGNRSFGSICLLSIHQKGWDYTLLVGKWEVIVFRMAFGALVCLLQAFHFKLGTTILHNIFVKAQVAGPDGIPGKLLVNFFCQ